MDELVGYALNGGWDEAVADTGTVREPYAGVLECLPAGLGALRDSVDAELARRGVGFGETPFVLDPVPRIFAAEEWGRLAAGVAQRVRALEAFVADAYGPRAAVEAGILPERVLLEAANREPALDGMAPPRGGWIGVAGLDIVRGADGELLVLEDNTRTPSGFAYAAAARQTLERWLPGAAPDVEEVVDAAYALLGQTIRAAAPEGAAGDPVIVLLSDGAGNDAFYEHREAARALGIPIVRLADLAQARGRLTARLGDRPPIPVDVVYRRTDEDRLTGDDGRPTPLGEALLEPWRAGRLGLVNGFGAGVADDKLVGGYVPKLVRFYLGEDPLLRTVPTFDLGDRDQRFYALDRLHQLVCKPRGGYGGRGVLIGPRASPEQLAAARAAIERDPGAYIAQETVALSTHPTVCGDVLQPRHVDLRPFAFSRGGAVSVLPGGLTRVALGAGEMMVNSSRDGGGKDTWVLR